MSFPIDPHDPTKGFCYFPGQAYYPSYSAYHGVQDGTKYPRYPTKDFLLMPAPVSNSLSLPASNTESSTSRSTTPIMLPSEPGSMPYPLPYPLLYPAPAPALQENRVPSGQSQMLSQAPQYPFAPPTMYPPGPPPHPHLAQQPLPPGARALSPPRPITADDLKYKCGVCGRFRSPRYHYKHPIPPGQLPKKTVCRKCRDAGTDSQESYDSTGRTTRYGRNRSRSRSRSRFSDEVEVDMLPDRDRRRLVRRSPSRVRIVQRSRSRGRRLPARSSYRSDPLDDDWDRLEIVEERRIKPRSPSVEIVERVRYIDEPPPRPRRRETVYIEERVPANRASGYEQVYYDDDELDLPPRRRVISRPATPMPRIIRRLSPDALTRAPNRIEHREYFDGPTSVVEETTEVIRATRPLSRPPSRSLTLLAASERLSGNRRHVSESEESEYTTEEDHGRRHRDENRARGRSRDSGGRYRRRRSSSRHSGISDEDLLDAPPRRYTRAPSPPPPPPPPSAFRSSSLGYMQPRRDRTEAHGTRTRQHEALDRQGRPVMLTRRERSRSRELDRPLRETLSLRPGDEVIEIERRRLMPTEDYDWYDKDGMRVRVREI